jgi:uncharacterized OsmC-like protein
MTTTTPSATRPFADIGEIRQTVDAVTANRELGKVTFTMTADATGGIASSIRTGALIQGGVADTSREGKFSATSDEPVALMGADTGISPAEYILTGLAGCYTVTLASLAASRGITLDEVRLSLGFDIDLSGFLGIDSTVRKGAQGITVDVEIDSPDATRDQLDALIASLEATSPIRDTIANPVKVTTVLH